MRAAVCVSAWFLLSAAGASAASMPAAQQNALVGKYCAVCHTDAAMNGGLSLEHFDAANADPGLAAMMVSKLRGGALGAAGGTLPDRATQDALEQALVAEAEGANRWAFHRTEGPSGNGDLLTASVVEAAPPATGLTNGKPDLYRLTVTCREDTHEANMQLAWSPGVPESGRVMSVSADGAPAIAYRVEGEERMGNGQAGGSGPGAISLGKSPAALPQSTLTASNLFGAEKIVFPFAELDGSARRMLSACMAGRIAGR